MKFNKYAKLHYDWVDEMGWHGTPIMALIALIGSEIGEAAYEALNPIQDSNNMGEELADICLRIMDLFYSHNVDIDKKVDEVSPTITWISQSLEGDFLELMSDFRHVVNSARHETLEDDFYNYLGGILCRVIDITYRNNIDLEETLKTKIEKNKVRGNKGRKI